MLDQRPLLYKGRTQIVASLASKMKHLVAAAPDQAYTVCHIFFANGLSFAGKSRHLTRCNRQHFMLPRLAFCGECSTGSLVCADCDKICVSTLQERCTRMGKVLLKI